jgi:hypothetical protein
MIFFNSILLLTLAAYTCESNHFVTQFCYTQASVSGASVKGLKGCKTLNKHPDPNNPIEGSEERSVSYFMSGILKFKFGIVTTCIDKKIKNCNY